MEKTIKVRQLNKQKQWELVDQPVSWNNGRMARARRPDGRWSLYHVAAGHMLAHADSESEIKNITRAAMDIMPDESWAPIPGEVPLTAGGNIIIGRHYARWSEDWRNVRARATLLAAHTYTVIDENAYIMEDRKPRSHNGTKRVILAIYRNEQRGAGAVLESRDKGKTYIVCKEGAPSATFLAGGPQSTDREILHSDPVPLKRAREIARAWLIDQK